jgi:hypothetical protein
MTEMPPAPEESGGATREPVAFADPTYRAAVVDLLGAIAYGEMSAFERLADDAKLAPTLQDRAELAAMASTEFGHFCALRDRLVELGADPFAAMEPFRGPFEAFHARTAPSDWFEGLVKAYVDAGTRTLIIDSLDDPGQAGFVVDRVRRAIDDDPRLGGRLALWGRRLMGEALSQAQRVAAERDALSALLAGGVDRPALDLAAIGRMFTRLTENHTDRMARLGLAS